MTASMRVLLTCRSPVHSTMKFAPEPPLLPPRIIDVAVMQDSLGPTRSLVLEHWQSTVEIDFLRLETGLVYKAHETVLVPSERVAMYVERFDYTRPDPTGDQP